MISNGRSISRDFKSEEITIHQVICSAERDEGSFKSSRSH